MKKAEPAIDPQSRQAQLITMAEELAEKKIRDGTASNQLIIHYLKLGTEESRAKVKELEQKIELMEAKTSAIKASENSEKLYEEAIAAMNIYKGTPHEQDI